MATPSPGPATFETDLVSRSGWNYAAVLRTVASIVPERTAVVCSGRRITYAEFDTRTDQLAAGLHRLGVAPGGKVAIDLLNSPQYLEVFYATLKLGAVPVNVNYRYRHAELSYLLDYVDADAIVVHDVFAEPVLRARRSLPRPIHVVIVPYAADEGQDADDVLTYDELLDGAPAEIPTTHTLSGDDLIFVCTGGTTGMPKAVMWRNDDLYVSQWMLSRPGVHPPDPAAAMRAGKRSATTLPGPPLMHGTGLYAALATLSGGGCVVLIDALGFDPVRVWNEVAAERVEVLTVVGDVFAQPLLAALDDVDADVSCLRVISSSGTIFSTGLKAALLDRLPGLRIIDSLGATEGMVGRSTATTTNLATVGFAVNERVGVFAADGRPITPGTGEAGFLGVTGRLPIGYYKDPAKTEATFRMIDGKRYSIAGDMATVGVDGSITFLGRGSATINTGGEKVYPEEVETEIRRLPGVLDCCVIGLADERWGQRVVAVVQLTDPPPHDERGIVEQLRPKLAGYKVPKEVVIAPSLGRGPNGKVDYQHITALATTATTTGGPIGETR